MLAYEAERGPAMSVRQNVVLGIGIAVFVGMGLYPPYNLHMPHPSGGALYGGSGYGLIFRSEEDGSMQYERRVDLRRLTVQWACVAAATAGVIVAAGKRNARKKETG